MFPEERSWKDGKTPEEIALLEERGRRLVDHLHSLDEHPEVPPSPVERTSIKAELEKRRQQEQGQNPADS